MSDRDKTLTGLDRWYVDFEYEPSYLEATATVYIPVDGSHSMRVEVATVNCLPLEEDGDEDGPQLVKEGKDAERLRRLNMIVHAPEMLDCIRRCLRYLNELTDGDISPDRPAWEIRADHIQAMHEKLNSEENRDLWVRLTEIADELDRANDLVTDLEYI